MGDRRSGLFALVLVALASVLAGLFHGFVFSVGLFDLQRHDSAYADPLRTLASVALVFSLLASLQGLFSYVRARRDGSFSLPALIATGIGATVLLPSVLYAIWIAQRFGTLYPPVPGRPLPGQPRRHTRAASWRETAEAESRSVVAFEQLAEELRANNAPSSLVSRCLDAANEEREHASLASAAADRLREPAQTIDTPAAAPRAIAAAALAAESLSAGLLGEGLMARAAEQWARASRDPEICRMLSQIAVEERRHADLAAAIVWWSWETDPEGTARALPRPLPFPPRPADLPGLSLTAAGAWKIRLAAFLEAERLRRSLGAARAPAAL